MDFPKNDLPVNPKKDVFGIEIEWDKANGCMRYAGETAMVMWVETAMKSFLETISEISGSQVANVVLETAGYRMGAIVSEFFKTGEINDIFQTLPSVYRAAGWGLTTVSDYSVENKTAVIQVKDSWEYRINKIQSQGNDPAFLPGHFAGLLSNLYEENIWYTIEKSQLNGDDCYEFYFSPSQITPTQNIHELTRAQEQREISKLEEMVEERTKDLRELVKEISSPLIPVFDDIVVIPLMGTYDDMRANELLHKTLDKLPEIKANYVILDLTGINDSIDEYMISLIQKMTQSAALLGSKCILVGISPKLSIEMTNANFTTRETHIGCYSTLKHAIMYALSQEGKQI
ncbi:STAS domain-containing protein [Salipaludibacillus sp. CUR1]|uniref:STAS domain-containing protein n=1 Tax=Salipaludibacillus sp. CUR1 TaxID=2820003 RepID=UPI001E28AAC1|nr:STAS domain-containing protein [Salipaludibacillus sp. CUR1]MCE7791149.1 STAS domain-containing protein [Salipaludibacillus sp. CUR1]